MKKLWLGVIGLAAATTANAAVVTYTLSYNDFGGGTISNGSWAVYASVSADSGGLFGFGVDLQPGAGGTIATLSNRSNGAVMSDSSTDEQLNLGFSTGRTQDLANGKFSGLADLSAGTALKPIYGFGQHPDNLNNYIPANFDTQQAIFGAGRTPYGVETITPAGGTPKNLFLLGRGTFTGTHPDFDKQSVDSKASVYVTNSGTANVVVPITYDYRDLGGPPPGQDLVSLGNTLDANHPNQAVGGAIAVTGSNGRYSSEVDQLLDPSVSTGGALIQSIGDEAGSVYVMAKLSGTPADIANVLSHTTQDVDASDSQFALLHQNYDSLFGGGGFNALFKFPNIAGAKAFQFEFTDPGHGAVMADQLAAVPEPATMSLLGLGALALLARRRRNA